MYRKPSATSQLSEFMAVSSLFWIALTGLIIYLALSLVTITSADARHRRRHHARPEIHRNLRPVDAGVRPIGQCNFTTWDEVNPDSISYPYATGSTVVDLTGRFPWN